MQMDGSQIPKGAADAPFYLPQADEAAVFTPSPAMTTFPPPI